MSPRRDDPAAVDQPEPEDVLSGPGRADDHLPADRDDRDVLLDEPAEPEPPIDDDDRNPATGG